MQVDLCGCVYDGSDGAWCPKHKAFLERASRVAMRISERRQCSYKEAYHGLWERLIGVWLRRVIEGADA